MHPYLPLKAQDRYAFPDKLDSAAVMSIVVASPIEDEVYTVYGHAGFRVNDPVQHIDVIFNYGIFAFNSDFTVRFIKGKTDYAVVPIEASYYMNEYLGRGSDVTELVLNMSAIEKQKAWEYLLWNIRPENSVYRYNFFYDNCSTRPVSIFSESCGGHLKFPNIKTVTWRYLINRAERNKPWMVLGTDLALGSKTDASASVQEQLFLPSKIIEYLPQASLVYKNGDTKPAVLSVRKMPYIIPAQPYTYGAFLSFLIHPLTVFSLLLVITFVISLMAWRRRKLYRIYDCIIFACAGLAGLLLFYLAFISEHPFTSPNYNLVVLHPLHLLLGVPLMLFKRLKKWGYYYHFVNFVVLSLFALLAIFLPQNFNAAMILVGGTLWIISVKWLMIQRKQDK